MKKLSLFVAALAASSALAFASFSESSPCDCCVDCSCAECLCDVLGCGECCDTGACCETGCCTAGCCEVK